MTPQESELLAQALKAMERVDKPKPRRSRQVIRRCLTCGGLCSSRALYCRECAKHRQKVMETMSRIKRKEQARLAARCEREIKFVRRITPGELEDVEHWT